MATTILPHWALWAADAVPSDLVLPSADIDSGASWHGTWTIYQSTSHDLDKAKTGFVEVQALRQRGAMELGCAVDQPQWYGWSVQTEALVTCRDDRLLTPLRWLAEVVTADDDGPLEQTRATRSGRVAGSELLLEGIDLSTTPLPEGQPLSSTWSMLGALPRLHRAGTDSLIYTLLADLLVARPDQELRRIEDVDVDLACGTTTLSGYHVHGPGTPGTWYWLAPCGWPVAVGGIGFGWALTGVEILDATEED